MENCNGGPIALDVYRPQHNPTLKTCPRIEPHRSNTAHPENRCQCDTVDNIYRLPADANGQVGARYSKSEGDGHTSHGCGGQRQYNAALVCAGCEGRECDLYAVTRGRHAERAQTEVRCVGSE